MSLSRSAQRNTPSRVIGLFLSFWPQASSTATSSHQEWWPSVCIGCTFGRLPRSTVIFLKMAWLPLLDRTIYAGWLHKLSSVWFEQKVAWKGQTPPGYGSGSVLRQSGFPSTAARRSSLTSTEGGRGDLPRWRKSLDMCSHHGLPTSGPPMCRAWQPASSWRHLGHLMCDQASRFCH